MLDDHNRNLGGDYALSDLTDDCRVRVRRNLQQIGQACVAGNYICKNCEALAEATPVAACGLANSTDQSPTVEGFQPCEANPLQVEQTTKECLNFDPQNGQADFKTVTNHLGVGDEPVCLADRTDPPVPIASPLGAGIFSRVTTCNVAGTARLVGADRDVNGVVNFTGEPCPGGACDVGMFYRLLVPDFSVTGGGFLGVDFGKAEFKELRGWGSSVAGGAALNTSGIGRFDAGELLSTGRGVVDKFACDPITHEGCIGLGTNTDIVLARNDGPLDITVQWNATQPWCSLTGTVSTLGDGFTVDMIGDIVNRPPKADAGADQMVECTAPAGATITLDGTGSADPDNNISFFSWRRDGRAGDQVSYQSVATVPLGLGETATYVLTVVDAFGQASYASTTAGVADTTAPAIACNAPATILITDAVDEDEPANVPISFTASASDTCDLNAGAAVVGFDCYKLQGGRRIDKKGSCAVSINGATIAILNGGGIGTHIRWTVEAQDDSGNVRRKDCEVVAVKR
jgi:hypothetical protein